MNMRGLIVKPIVEPPRNRAARRTRRSRRWGARRIMRPWERDLTWDQARAMHARGVRLSHDVLDLVGIRYGVTLRNTAHHRASVTRSGRTTTSRRTAAHRSACKASSSAGDDGGGEPPLPRERVALAFRQVAAAGFVPEGGKS